MQVEWQIHILEFESTNAQEESITVATIAQQKAEQRAKDGIKLVIPLKNERNKNEPLLSSFKRIMEHKNDNDRDSLELDADAQATEALIHPWRIGQQ